MKLKTYRAPSMTEALTQVKKDLGKDAVILHTRHVKVGGLLGLGRKTLIEITAADEPVPTRRPRPPAPPAPTASPAPPAEASPTSSPARGTSASLSPAALSAYAKTAAVTSKTSVPAAPSERNPGSHSGAFGELAPRGTAGRPPAAPSEPSEASPALFSAPSPSPRSLATPPSGQSAPSPRPSPSDDDDALLPVRPRARARELDTELSPSIHRELADLKLLINQVLHAQPVGGGGALAGAMPEALFRHYLRLLESAVARDIADSVIGAVRDELTPAELHDEAIVRVAVLRHLAAMIPVAGDVARPRGGAGGGGGGGPLVVALVGPTGVGKTTTIAKLAAAYKLRHGRSVALITSDTYRIAAVDQLRTYAGIIGLPLKVVMTPAEMAAAVESFRQYDVVLIDTAGRSQFNTDRLGELREFLAAAGPTETHLVLSTTAAEPVLVKTAESFAALRPSRIILTKLDEAVNFGVILNVARRLQTSLSFITTGQEVPDDLEAGHPDRLARMVLDNAVAAPRGRPAPVREPTPQPEYAAAAGTVSA